ncbi:hypothetical protein GCM10010399_64670 [Dactylosporangium fulvum]
MGVAGADCCPAVVLGARSAGVAGADPCPRAVLPEGGIRGHRQMPAPVPRVVLPGAGVRGVLPGADPARCCLGTGPAGGTRCRAGRAHAVLPGEGIRGVFR